MRGAGITRNWENVLRELAARGHDVRIGYELERDPPVIAERLRSEFSNLSFDMVPGRTDRWRRLAYGLRQTLDYLRYLEPEYEQAERLRRRAARHTIRWLRLLAASRRSSPRLRRALAATLRALERSLPRDRAIDAAVRRLSPDAVLATPLVSSHAQTDWLRSARAAGVPAVLAVTSWDNLTNKGLVHPKLDRVYVWNELQRGEAQMHHGIPSELVVAVGAHAWDHWFGWTPTRTREAFCAEVGLDYSRPFMLYVGSSKMIVEDERPVVVRWLRALRASDDPQLRHAGVLIRPYPSKVGRLWVDDEPLRGEENVAVWPRAGAETTTDRARRDYFDSLYYAAAVVGVNTSALIEAAIVGRRTYSFTLPELHGGQAGTLHFRYLLSENGGPLTLAGTLEEHVHQLASALAGQDEDTTRAFVESFVRPLGIDTPSAPVLVDDLEELVASCSRRLRR